MHGVSAPSVLIECPCVKGDKLPFRVLVRLGREAVAVSETFILKSATSTRASQAATVGPVHGSCARETCTHVLSRASPIRRDVLDARSFIICMSTASTAATAAPVPSGSESDSENMKK